jgi:hypothetical protein
VLAGATLGAVVGGIVRRVLSRKRTR